MLKRDIEKLISSNTDTAGIEEVHRSRMATQEQVQEALQRLQAQEARIDALETQLQFEQTGTQTAELERSTLIQTLRAMRQDRGGAGESGIGQPFIQKGIAEQDFGEWTHKVRTFMLARFRDQILSALTWAARQRRIVVKACGSSQRDRFVPWINVSGEQADEEDKIDGIDDFVGKLYAYLVFFTTEASNRIVRNGGDGNGLEAWRRLHGEYDPRRPCDAWLSFSRFRTLRDASELRIWDLRWRTGSLKNVNTRCSLTVTDDPARHQMAALWRR